MSRRVHSAIRALPLLALIALTLPLTHCSAESRRAAARETVPTWCGQMMRRHGLTERLEIHTKVAPHYQRGDFDGDGRIDCAVLVRAKKGGKVGIVILHRNGRGPFVLGAGNEFGNGGDDWDWLGIWSLFPGERVPDRKAEGRDALLVEKPESAGGIVYWDGREYAWQQWGD